MSYPPPMISETGEDGKYVGVIPEYQPTRRISVSTGLKLYDLLLMRLAWKDQFVGKTLPLFGEYSVYPTNKYPNGQKGLVIANAWENISTPRSDGLVIYDGDVVIDPVDYGTLMDMAATEREAVWTTPARIWPRRTQLPEWVWSHRKEVEPDCLVTEVIRQGQIDIDDPDSFSFCFTYLPRRLIEGTIKKGLKKRAYPGVDKFMWQTAKELGIPVRVAHDCHPKHLNW